MQIKLQKLSNGQKWEDFLGKIDQTLESLPSMEVKEMMTVVENLTGNLKSI